MELGSTQEKTEEIVGSYFVANYPPFSAWSAEHVPAVVETLDKPAPAKSGPEADPVPLGLYIHIPFCRKRCKFCYFRVFTDKNARDVDRYIAAVAQESAMYADRSALRSRNFEFVYFGGGTPSFLSKEQLRLLVDSIGRHWDWAQAREVTFECEPGTLNKAKLEMIKSIGTTRLSLGVEHFDDEVLGINGRAHNSSDIGRAYQWAREAGFDQINIDLIAGMLGDDEAGWHEAVDRALAMQPDSLTVYQMELPYNTRFVEELNQSGRRLDIADWPTKRAWLDYAFGVFEEAGYVSSSAYTVVKPSEKSGFVYRDSLWHGADMIGLGVASFSHLAGIHFQNADRWDNYLEVVERGNLPLSRALPITESQRMIRELILQLKLGRVDAGYFRQKFSVEIRNRFEDVLDGLDADDLGSANGDKIELTRKGLLRVDSLLPRFFEPEFQNVRYT